MFMKEIDFLPEWYKSGIRRQGNYRMQYIILSGLFAVMMVWNFVSANSVSSARAKYLEMESIRAQSENASNKLKQYKNEIVMLHEREKMLDSIDSKIKVSNVLAELSFLVDERIVLSRVELISEIIPVKQAKEKSLQSASVVKISGQAPGNIPGAQVGNIRFKVLIAGVAANGRDVAALLCKLEDSPYFNRVDLSYSRDAKIKTAGSSLRNSQQDAAPENLENLNESVQTKENIQASEFEINCYLSNYIQQE